MIFSTENLGLDLYQRAFAYFSMTRWDRHGLRGILDPSSASPRNCHLSCIHCSFTIIFRRIFGICYLRQRVCLQYALFLTIWDLSGLGTFSVIGDACALSNKRSYVGGMLSVYVIWAMMFGRHLCRMIGVRKVLPLANFWVCTSQAFALSVILFYLLWVCSWVGVFSAVSGHVSFLDNLQGLYSAFSLSPGNTGLG